MTRSKSAILASLRTRPAESGQHVKTAPYRRVGGMHRRPVRDIPYRRVGDVIDSVGRDPVAMAG